MAFFEKVGNTDQWSGRRVLLLGESIVLDLFVDYTEGRYMIHIHSEGSTKSRKIDGHYCLDHHPYFMKVFAYLWKYFQMEIIKLLSQFHAR